MFLCRCVPCQLFLTFVKSCDTHTHTHTNTNTLTAAHWNPLQHISTHWNTLEHTATHGNSLQLTCRQCQASCKNSNRWHRRCKSSKHKRHWRARACLWVQHIHKSPQKTPISPAKEPYIFSQKPCISAKSFYYVIVSASVTTECWYVKNYHMDYEIYERETVKYGLQGGEDPNDALSSEVIFRKRAL